MTTTHPITLLDGSLAQARASWKQTPEAAWDLNEFVILGRPQASHEEREHVRGQLTYSPATGTPYTIARHTLFTQELTLTLAPGDRRGFGLAGGVGGRTNQAQPWRYYLTPGRASKFETLYADGWWYIGGSYRLTEHSTTGFPLSQAMAIAKERPFVTCSA